jgi:hypothetical protein
MQELPDSPSPDRHSLPQTFERLALVEPRFGETRSALQW